MKRFEGDRIPFEPADPRNFVGSARVKRLPMVEERGQSVIVYLVEFEPGGRTNWHRHSCAAVAARERRARPGAEMGGAGAGNWRR